MILRVEGTVQVGRGDFAKRLEKFAEIFRAATGQDLYRGTLNVRVKDPVEIQEHFRCDDPLDAEQVLQFEVCRANGRWAYRIRPRHKRTGSGGWGDDVIEVACSEEIPKAAEGQTVQIEFFR